MFTAAGITAGRHVAHTFFHGIQNYWVFGLFPSSVFWKLENTTIRRLDLFSSSGEAGEEWKG
jgi:hypothetical protein